MQQQQTCAAAENTERACLLSAHNDIASQGLGLEYSNAQVLQWAQRVLSCIGADHSLVMNTAAWAHLRVRHTPTVRAALVQLQHDPARPNSTGKCKTKS